MNKKLVGSVIAIVAVIALVTVFMLTRPDSDNSNTKDTSSTTGEDSMTGMDAAKQNGANTDEDNPPATETTTVDIKDFAYSPKVIKAKQGATVTWTNSDSAPHTVTGTNGATFESGNMEQGKKFSFTFDKAGTFTYKCAYHPNMTGTVIVE